MLSAEQMEGRCGLFNASENHKLMAGWGAEKPNTNYEWFESVRQIMKPLHDNGERSFLVGTMQPLFDFKITGEMLRITKAAISAETIPAGLITYAKQRAVGELFQRDPNEEVSTGHMRNGNEREPEAMRLLSEWTGLDFQSSDDAQVSFVYDGVGCTPDGVVYDDLDLVAAGGEVKCKSAYHHSLLLTLNNSEDMKREEFAHYVQVQTGMMILDAPVWYFGAYNPFGITDGLRFKSIEVPRDDALIEVLKERIEIAKKIKAEFKQKLLDSTNPAELIKQIEEDK